MPEIKLGRECEIQKAWSSDLLAREYSFRVFEVFQYRFRDHTRRLLGIFGPEHRHVRRQIAELPLFRRLKKQRGEFCRIQLSPLRRFLDGSSQKLLKVTEHRVLVSSFSAPCAGFFIRQAVLPSTVM